ncbi:hypothetical protein DW943_05235 [Collinsella sp. AM44-11]|nr:hypothetical protein DW943_05235 [Collinsella sp. AM44-11]
MRPVSIGSFIRVFLGAGKPAPRANGGRAHQVREGHGPEDVGARGLMQADCEEPGKVAFDGEL